MKENYQNFFYSLKGKNFSEQLGREDGLSRFAFNNNRYVVYIGKCSSAVRKVRDEFRTQLSGDNLKKIKANNKLGYKILFCGYNKNSNTFTFYDPDFLLNLEYKKNKSYFTRLSVMNEAAAFGLSIYIDEDKKNIISLKTENIKHYLDFYDKKPHLNYKKFKEYVETNSSRKIQDFNYIYEKKKIEQMLDQQDEIDSELLNDKYKNSYAKNSEKKVAVEKRAMFLVKEYYEEKNWIVKDCSKTRGLGYDFSIKNKKGNKRMIEVKGLQKKSRINLTINEVNFAKRNTEIAILAIVYGIRLKKEKAKWVGLKGKLKIIDPINLDDSKLLPTQFSYDWE